MRNPNIEIRQVSQQGFSLRVGDDELFVSFDAFPWFRQATLDDLTSIEWPTADHLYWPRLDIDLSIDSIRDPDAFPLVSGAVRRA